MDTHDPTARSYSSYGAFAATAIGVACLSAWAISVEPNFVWFIATILICVGPVIPILTAVVWHQRQQVRRLEVVYPVLTRQAIPDAWHEKPLAIELEFRGEAEDVIPMVVDALLDIALVQRESWHSYRVVRSAPGEYPIDVRCDFFVESGRTTCCVELASGAPHIGSIECVEFPFVVADAVRSTGGSVRTDGPAVSSESLLT